MRCGHVATDECPSCHMPAPCTHIEGEYPNHEALRISRHNAACQLIHAAIRKAAKGRGALHSAPDLILVMTDTGFQPMTIEDSIELLSTTSEDIDLSLTTETTPHDWLAPLLRLGIGYRLYRLNRYDIYVVLIDIIDCRS